MARDSDQRAGSFEIENTGGLMSGLLAEEDVFDRRALWRIGSWGVAAVAAVVLAVLANQSQLSLRREQVAAADLTRQAQQLQSFAKESTNETRRLASAVDTLNSDRDRLYSRVTVLEQGLDSVTGAIAKQNAAAAQPQAAVAQPQVAASPAPAVSPMPGEPKSVAQNPAPVPSPSPATAAPAVAPVATTMAMLPAKPVDKPPAAAPEQAPATVVAVAPKTADPPQPVPPPVPLVAAKSMMAPPDPAATKLIEPEKPAKTVTAGPMPEVVAAAPAADKMEADTPPAAVPQAATADVAVQKTEFGVDIGGANSVPGLRALWRGLLKSRSNAALLALHPIMVIREGNNGLGIQLRLVAGPLSDAAAAAKICAGLIENDRPCETAVFDGQRLAMKADEQPVHEPKASATKPAAEAKPVLRRHVSPRRVSSEETAKKPDTVSTLSSFFGGGKSK